MRKSWILLPAVFSVALLSGCYSFKGISIEPDVNTYYVGNFKNNAVNSPQFCPRRRRKPCGRNCGRKPD